MIRLLSKYLKYFCISSVIDLLLSIDYFRVLDWIIPCTIVFLMKTSFRLFYIRTISMHRIKFTFVLSLNYLLISQVKGVCIRGLAVFHFDNNHVFIFWIKIKLKSLFWLNKFWHKRYRSLWSRNPCLNFTSKFQWSVLFNICWNYKSNYMDSGSLKC